MFVLIYRFDSLWGRYGLGTCYMRMSKLRLADYHYRKAVSIHPQNAVLLGCVGMVSHRTRLRTRASVAGW